MTRPSAIASSLVLLVLATAAGAEPSWTEEQQEIVDAIAALSATTAPDGAGAAAYGALLADDFSRWGMGSEPPTDKASWVEGVAEWFDDGWRVVERDSRYLEITIEGDVAVVRRVVRESYRGPRGDTSDSTSAVRETWVRRDDRWLLWRADVRPVEP